MVPRLFAASATLAACCFFTGSCLNLVPFGSDSFPLYWTPLLVTPLLVTPPDRPFFQEKRGYRAMANAFGRILNVAGAVTPRGGPVPINLPGYPAVYPSIAPESIQNGVEYFMFQTGIIYTPPTVPLFTRLAAGGCVPICACEINAAGQVLWTYLMHGHGGNNPLNVAGVAGNVANVFICMSVYSGASSFWAAQNMQGTFFSALDPFRLGHWAPVPRTLRTLARFRPER